MKDIVLVKRENGNSIVDINIGIKNKIDLVKEGLKYNPELREKAINRVVEKKVVEEIEFNYDISGINSVCL
jgi:hypothetical protein